MDGRAGASDESVVSASASGRQPPQLVTVHTRLFRVPSAANGACSAVICASSSVSAEGAAAFGGAFTEGERKDPGYQVGGRCGDQWHQSADAPQARDRLVGE